MKPTVADFMRLRWSLLLFVTLVSLGATTVFAARRSATIKEIAAKEVLAQRDEVRSLLSHAGTDELELRAKIDRYREMQARGIIGRERRLEWVESIAQIRNARRLIDVQYELAPQKPALLTGGNAVAGYEFLASTMALRMQLLHEDDLLGFLADLAGSVSAFPRVRSCDVERIADAAPGAAQLRADCTIDWITLKEKA